MELLVRTACPPSEAPAPFIRSIYTPTSDTSRTSWQPWTFIISGYLCLLSDPTNPPPSVPLFSPQHFLRSSTSRGLFHSVAVGSRSCDHLTYGEWWNSRFVIKRSRLPPFFTLSPSRYHCRSLVYFCTSPLISDFLSQYRLENYSCFFFRFLLGTKIV